MRLGLLYIIFCTIFLTKLQAQLSPGDLAQSHADLEGLFNCTKCHVLGRKVSDEKCLDCHDEIKSRNDIQVGYHASKEVKNKNCAECHSDHHGRNFDMIRFEEDDFDHNLTGYELTGAHEEIDCRDCHIPDFVMDSELKKKKETYLGLSQDCIDCHTDYHQNTLSDDCASCHTTEVFSPADLFSHDDTDFALLGAHENVDCIDCHQMETRNGEDFQRFADVEFDNCTSCHEDVHQNNLGTNCKDCHSEESFTYLNFDHRSTNFPLNGAHKQIGCAQCHNMDVSLDIILQDRIGVQTTDCIDCHEDVHDNKFGSNCIECHNEDSFFQVPENLFDHSKTDFDLVGKHKVVDCRECHVESYTEPLPHNECASCHVDYHEEQFVSNGKGPDCSECHTEDGFEESLFTIANHQETVFPLEGAHIATPCFSCHLKNDKWSFREIGQRCVDCHEDVHSGYIDEQYYVNQSCESCHSTVNWTENHFDHNLTEFELLGVHAEQDCRDCHMTAELDDENKYEGFSNIGSECTVCHENVHDSQFEENGHTDCARCHGFQNWGVDDFNHDNTAFKLDGKHINLACEACHKEIQTNGKKYVQYKIESFECIDCHL